LIVEWRAKAREERHNIFDYIAADNPVAALELDDEIERKTETLPEHPELYRAGRMRGTREMVLGPNYILVYRILKNDGIIEIVRIVGARQVYPEKKKK
jgi:toxin ParE1/3/4